MLEEFIALYDKPVEAILSYSKRWGILGICEEHGLPLGHGCPPRYGSTYPSGAEDGDPISSWREYSKAANAILEIYASLSAGHTPDIKLWEHAIRPGKPHPDTDHYVQENLKDLDGTYHPLAAFENTPWIKWQKNSFFWAYARVAGNARVTREEVAFVVNEWMRIGGVRPHWSPPGIYHVVSSVMGFLEASQFSSGWS